MELPELVSGEVANMQAGWMNTISNAGERYASLVEFWSFFFIINTDFIISLYRKELLQIKDAARYGHKKSPRRNRSLEKILTDNSSIGA